MREPKQKPRCISHSSALEMYKELNRWRMNYVLLRHAGEKISWRQVAAYTREITDSSVNSSLAHCQSLTFYRNVITDQLELASLFKTGLKRYLQNSWIKSISFTIVLSVNFTVESRSITDFEGPTNHVRHRWNSVVANRGNKRNKLEGTMNLHLLRAEFCWWRYR